MAIYPVHSCRWRNAAGQFDKVRIRAVTEFVSSCSDCAEDRARRLERRGRETDSVMGYALDGARIAL